MLVACTSESADTSYSTSFSAHIIEVGENSLLVTPLESANERNSADQISVSLLDADLFDAKNESITANDFREGMLVQIEYDGKIAESYPAQIHRTYEIRIEAE